MRFLLRLPAQVYFIFCVPRAFQSIIRERGKMCLAHAHCLMDFVFKLSSHSHMCCCTWTVRTEKLAPDDGNCVTRTVPKLEYTAKIYFWAEVFYIQCTPTHLLL